MSIASRILDAVRRRVVAILLLGGFAEAIFSFVRWLLATGWHLAGTMGQWACLRAGLIFAIDAGLIYLALRGLGSLLDGWRTGRAVAAELAAIDERDRTVSFEDEGAGDEEASWPREGGGDDRPAEHY